jgi:CheY-specific phosphatase CheX
VEQQILEVFIEAVRQVFQETGITIATVGFEEEPLAEDHVITSVGITGDLKGIFMLRTDSPSAASILRAMTDGFRIAFKEDTLSGIQMAALGELTNQITGRAITLLFDRQVHCEITPPAVVAARQLQSLVPDLAASFSRTVRGPFGRLTLFLGMQKPRIVPQEKKLVDNS